MKKAKISIIKFNSNDIIVTSVLDGTLYRVHFVVTKIENNTTYGSVYHYNLTTNKWELYSTNNYGDQITYRACRILKT